MRSGRMGFIMPCSCQLPTLRVTGSIAADQAVERAPQGAVGVKA